MDRRMSRKTVAGYLEVLDDLLLAFRLDVFTRRARRNLAAHPRFFYFDTGVFRSLRPAGPLDRPEEIEGAALKASSPSTSARGPTTAVADSASTTGERGPVPRWTSSCTATRASGPWR